MKEDLHCCVSHLQVYYISKGTLKIANKQYTSLKNDYEMTLNGESTIIPCDDTQDVPMVQCNFVSVADLETRDKDAIVGKMCAACQMSAAISLFSLEINAIVAKVAC